MRSLTPQIKAIQKRYAGDQVISILLHFFCDYVLAVSVCMTEFDNLIYLQEKIQLETARLYKLAGINPLAGR